MATGQAAIAAAFARQIEWCESLGSPFTAGVLRVVARDLAAGGIVASLVGAWPGDPLADALALRLAAALHSLVLTGSAPALAACYPPHPTPPHEALGDAILSALATHAEAVRYVLGSPPQTNEVGRSAVLVGGFHRVALRTGLPLHLLEIGASAGLNLNWDLYRYQLGPAAWGPETSSLVLAPQWAGSPPEFANSLRVAERAGCDIAPIDLDDSTQRLRLRSYVWADQPDRLDRLDRAVALARACATRVERADASTWVPARLAQRIEGRATVLYHSIMWHYLPESTRRGIVEAMQGAGRHATAAAPLAWLRFEPTAADAKPELHLTLWPGEQAFRLAIASAHGTRVDWLPDEP